MSVKISDTGITTGNFSGYGSGSVLVKSAAAVSSPARITVQQTYVSVGCSITYSPAYTNSTIFFMGNVQSTSGGVVVLKMFRDGVAMTTNNLGGNTNGYGGGEEPDMTFYSSQSNGNLLTIPYMNWEPAGGIASRTYDLRARIHVGTGYVNNRATDDMASFSHVFLMEFLTE